MGVAGPRPEPLPLPSPHPCRTCESPGIGLLPPPCHHPGLPQGHCRAWFQQAGTGLLPLPPKAHPHRTREPSRPLPATTDLPTPGPQDLGAGRGAARVLPPPPDRPRGHGSPCCIRLADAARNPSSPRSLLALPGHWGRLAAPFPPARSRCSQGCRAPTTPDHPAPSSGGTAGIGRATPRSTRPPSTSSLLVSEGLPASRDWPYSKPENRGSPGPESASTSI